MDWIRKSLEHEVNKLRENGRIYSIGRPETCIGLKFEELELLINTLTNLSIRVEIGNCPRDIQSHYSTLKDETLNGLIDTIDGLVKNRDSKIIYIHSCHKMPIPLTNTIKLAYSILYQYV